MLPFVIDNRTARLDQALNRILADHAGRSVDVATAYFSVRGFQLTAEGLANVGNFRLLLGSWPASYGLGCVGQLEGNGERTSKRQMPMPVRRRP